MSVYRFYDPAPVFFSTLGVDVVVNGELTFYDRGTTNLRDTWSDPEQTTLNTNPVPCDSSGRPNVNVFLEGEYTVKIEGDNLAALERDVVPEVSASATLPTLNSGEFLTGDGTNYLAATIREMPDATGSTGQIAVTDGGGGYVLQDIPDFTPEDPEVVVAAGSFQAGVSTDATKFYTQWGTGSASASGARETTASIIFAVPFDVLWHVTITPQGSGFTANSDLPRFSITTQSVTGFTVRFVTGENSTSTVWDIINAINFTYAAFGTIEVP